MMWKRSGGYGTSWRSLPGGLLILILYLPVFLSGQTSTPDPADFLALVLQNHPEARRAELLIEQAAAYELRARGGFDPELFGDYSSKDFTGTDYWDISEAGLNIPTVGGLEFKTGYRAASGDFLNPENKLPKVGQAFIGLKANLLQGLLTDDRRTGLARAQLLGSWNQLRRAALYNDLAYDALLAFIDWNMAAAEVKLLNEVLQLTGERLEQTRQGFLSGDRAGLDTLETALIRDQRLLERSAANAQLVAAARLLQTFVWEGDNGIGSLRIDAWQPLDPAFLIAFFQGRTPGLDHRSNPELLAYEFKLRDLELERRLKAQKRLPKLSVKYEMIGSAFDFSPTAGGNESVGSFLLQDNKFAAAFTHPLFMRDARGDLRLNELKQLDTQLERNLKDRALQQKMLQYRNQRDLQLDQYELQLRLVEGYRQLLEAERIRFRVGDSSVFLLNSRETKWLEARRKLLKTSQELIKNWLAMAYVSGSITQL